MSDRILAARLLGRVLRDGAYSNVALAAAETDWDERRRRRVRALLFGTLRRLDRIDRSVAAASHRPLQDIDPGALDAIRVAVWELLFGETPQHAAVAAGVETARRLGGARVAGFVNAVLRRVAKAGEAPAGESRDGLAPWIGACLDAAWGPEAVDDFVAASLEPPRPGLWVRSGPAPDDPVPGVPGAYTGPIAGGVATAVAEGRVLVMDPASVAAAQALAVGPGERVLDLAAAPGGKTAVLAAALGDDGVLVAADRHRSRLNRARRRLARLGLHPTWVCADATRPPFRPGSFDAVLLDAPCTGLGTVRRRPELRWRLESGAPARLGRLQRRMLEAALPLVAPGGRLVYSVCTLFPEETVDVVAGLGAAAPPGLPGKPWGDGLLLGPHLTGTDGMYLAMIPA